MVTRIILATLFLTLLTGCVGGQMYTTEVQDDGQFYQVTDVGHVSLLKKGAEYSLFETCVWDENTGTMHSCKTVGTRLDANNTIAEQVFGPAATVGAAELIDFNVNNSGSSSSSTSDAVGVGVGGAGGNANASASGGCHGNCGGQD